MSKLGFPKSCASLEVIPRDHGLEAHATKFVVQALKPARVAEKSYRLAP
jgi:hypothetical protein